MALSSGLRAARRRARRNMPDEWAIYRETQEWDEATETNVTTTTTLYIGPGGLSTYEPHETVTVTTGAATTTQRYALKIPADAVTAEEIAIGDLAVPLKGKYNPSLVGSKYRIRALHGVSRDASQRLQVTQEVPS